VNRLLFIRRSRNGRCSRKRCLVYRADASIGSIIPAIALPPDGGALQFINAIWA